MLRQNLKPEVESKNVKEHCVADRSWTQNAGSQTQGLN